jgi:uncharacterized protein YaeQ
MGFRPERWEFRMTLSDSDREVHEDLTAVVSRHPSEAVEHLCLRALAYALLH